MKHSLRSLLKSPGYTAIALVTLALGIGVNTAMFSLVDAMLFNAGAYPESERIVQLRGVTRQGEFEDFSEPDVRELRRISIPSLSSLTVSTRSGFTISEPGEPAEQLGGYEVSPDVFTTFGLQPALGRAFTSEEGEPGKNNVIILSHTYWQAHYAGDPGVLGRIIRMDGVACTIIGVMPADFEHRPLWGRTSFWRPLNFKPSQINVRDYRTLLLFGRLAPNAQPGHVTAELAALAREQEKENPRLYAGLRYRVLPLHEALMDDTGRRVSWLLIGLAGFVLLIACANLANLQLARATAAGREFAIRAALGASRARLVKQQLAESLLLAIAGGALGIVVALWVNGLLEQTLLIEGQPALSIPLNGTVLSLTLAVSLLTGGLFGLVPALVVSRTDVSSALKQQSRGATGGRTSQRLRHLLIVGEVALALVLLGGAGILQRGFAQLLRREIGWDTTKILSANLTIPERRFATNEQRIELYRRIEQRVAALPGVESVATSTSVPLLNFTSRRQVLVEGQAPGSADSVPEASHVMVTADYFRTLGVELIAGRGFAPDLKPSSPQYVIVNETLARQFWPNDTAIGKRIASLHDGRPVWREVIGVARDVEAAAALIEPETRFVIYRPIAQETWTWVYLLVRCERPTAMAETVRRALAEADPEIPATNFTTVPQFIRQQQHNLVVITNTLTGFAALGLVLAAIGLYGVISRLVAQRTGEFGIRMALGAQPRDVLKLVLHRGLRLAACGLMLGLIGAYALGRLLGAAMPRLASPDPIALSAVAALLFVVTLVASYLPARRATRVDPISTLRAE